MSILDEIVASKRSEVARLREWKGAVEARLASAPEPRDFAGALRRDGKEGGGDGGEVAVIAEVKRRSPGAGDIRPGLNPAGLALMYQEGGASAVSVLTDEEYFGGSLDDLRAVRERVDLPVLRKDFVIDPVQVTEARGGGADCVLLIVRILDDDLLAGLLEKAGELGMAALVEVHDETELQRALDAGAEVVGVNNRDLSTFETRLEVTLEMVHRIPPDVVLVSESGIRTGDDVARLGEAGVDAVLVGESLLRQPDPGAAVRELAGHARVGRS
ncbi:MAG: indole-3-glycerol phosphate synthase TrpC [Longimicrobiales bacterium]|nr:indole-3-glycerol phosphate synthase TrpC [Longimicrobiales bacterium]